MQSVRKRVTDRSPVSHSSSTLLGATSRRPPTKSIIYFIRNLRLMRLSSPALYFIISAVVLILFFLLQSSASHSLPAVTGYTTINSPTIQLPKPHGFGKAVMERVLARVSKLVLGGSRISKHKLYLSADDKHLHGVHVGYDPDTGLPDWQPQPFDFSQETNEMKREAHTKSCFNKRRSNSLPLDRTLPEVRNEQCLSQWYYDPTRISESSEQQTGLLARLGLSSKQDTDRITLPHTSVVFVFYNEPLATLLRSVHSVLNRTPRHLLQEIILVDDGSDEEAPWLLEGGELERHIQLLPKIRYARLVGRNGLMVARNVGASLASGDTITFLDSHIEVGEGWAEPLMGRIAEGLRDGIRRVVVPSIDNIDADSFEFKAGGIDILGHTWGLGQTGIAHQPDEDNLHAIRSPIMAGGLLAIARVHFDEFGYYDPEMQLWGGEEMEISFRIWLCGGTLEWMPCSRIGHVFRSSKYWQGQVYKVPGEVISRNKRRASFWMDQYGQLVGLSAAPSGDVGPMEYYHEIKKRLQCKPYQWYLENVYTKMLESAKQLIPNESAKVGAAFRAFGFLRNKELDACLDNLLWKGGGNPYGVYPCHNLRGSQSVVFTKANLIMSGELLVDGCLTRSSNSRLRQLGCSEEEKGQQEWEMKQVEGEQNKVQIVGEGKCLTITDVAEVENKSPYSLEMRDCDVNGTHQHWEWEQIGDE